MAKKSSSFEQLFAMPRPRRAGEKEIKMTKGYAFSLLEIADTINAPDFSDDLYGNEVKCLGPTEDVVGDHLDMKTKITVRDGGGAERQLFKVTAPLEIEH